METKELLVNLILFGLLPLWGISGLIDWACHRATNIETTSGLRESLMATELTDASPDEMVLIGVVPETVEQGTTLSAPVQAAVDEVVKTVLAELERLGVTPVALETPRDPELWWV